MQLLLGQAVALIALVTQVSGRRTPNATGFDTVDKYSRRPTTCGGSPTPTTQTLKFDDLTVAKSILPLPTSPFIYQNEFHLSDASTLSFVNCTLFSKSSAGSTSCSSGSAALLSNGKTSDVTFAAPGQNYSYYQWFNLSSLRITNFEDCDILVSFYPSVVSSYQSTFQASEQSLTATVSRRMSRKLLDAFSGKGFNYLQGFSFDAVVDAGTNETEKSASIIIDDLEIVRPHTVPCTTLAPTQAVSSCPKTTTNNCRACVPAFPTTVTQILKFDDINTQGTNISVPVHYKGYSFPEQLRVLRAPKAQRYTRPYGSRHRPRSSALYGQPTEPDDTYSGFAISFGAEQFNLFSVEDFYITVVNVSNPSIAPTRPATVHIRTWAPKNNVLTPSPDLAFTVPAGEELFRFKGNSSQPSLDNIAEINVKALVDDSPDQQAGIILYDVKTYHIFYSTIRKKCKVAIQSLTFDDVDTSSGQGNVFAPEVHQGFRLHLPTSEYHEPAPWNITQGSVYDLGPGAKLASQSARKILLANDTIPFDEVRSISSASDSDFDLTSLILGIPENGSNFFLIIIYGFNKCGDEVAKLNRTAVAYPGNEAVIDIRAGAFAEAGFFKLRSLQFGVSSPTGDPRGVVRSVPFWLDGLEYRQSSGNASCKPN
ncbi:MAG: hypothetical protein M1812_004282 [Candelaria pacifica]|nr:MAG: hypothetical protein M1812_004282 [Candelaria pacifica]